ncbi:uncharacterized protein LOC129731048 isoform X2 [Wyeomyia smithii]|uniref:uncharacterized protein LOC129731048 isoform X2 n=1 Tax=Wyeomyia smithii TaxID=174621 RepID=UPI002467E172|nr:uncharacterized protein LOC129731048 isoform X2 [Wyeomyia smithii]
MMRKMHFYWMRKTSNLLLKMLKMGLLLSKLKMQPGKPNVILQRRIYYFGMQGITPQRERTDSTPTTSTTSTDNQQYYIFTVYGSQGAQEPTNISANSEQSPPNYEATRPPPKYEEVITSPETFEKPPAYSRV